MDDREEYEPEKDRPAAAPQPPNLRSPEEQEEERVFLLKEEERLLSGEERHALHVERRARELGLPTDPEAYQDGGLAAAATAPSVNEADLMAGMLCDAGIPAWVEGGGTATWYWYMQNALHPGGIRILVPVARLDEARTLVAEHGQAAPDQPDEAAPDSATEAAPNSATEAAPDQPDEAAPDQPHEETPLTPPEAAGYELRRSARRVAYLLIMGCFAPLTFILAVVTLRRINREMRSSGPSSDLLAARRIAVGTVIFSSLWLCLLVFGLRTQLSLIPRLPTEIQKGFRFVTPVEPATDGW
jgi:hypothetical protein